MAKTCITLWMLVWTALAGWAQPAQPAPQWEWFLDQIVSETFVGRNYFEYYYTPSAADMAQQRSRGEVTYFLNTPEGLNGKKVRDMIDQLMASYDDIKAMCNWQTTSTTYWKEYRFDNNKFRFSIKRKVLDDGTYYVSATETAGHYKSLKNKSKEEISASEPVAETPADKPVKRATHDRRAITQQDVEAAEAEVQEADSSDEAAIQAAATPVVSARERRQAEREREEALKQEERQAKQRAREEQRAQEKAQKEADRQRKAEEKKQKEEQKRLKREEDKRQREQARQEREQARKEQEAARERAQSKYHVEDVALWLSEKYGFTQTAGDDTSCTMYSLAVQDTEMAKLAIKNALKGSNARMAVPWRLNSDTQAIETGYTVDGHVLVFTIGKNSDGNISLTITEVSAEAFKAFKQGMGNE